MRTSGIQRLTQFHGPEEIPGERRSRPCIGMHPLDQRRCEGLCLFTGVGFHHPVVGSFRNYKIPEAAAKSLLGSVGNGGLGNV